ncbi:MAG: HAD hydrolase-like protein [Phycisphaerales bacterium]|jgi:phosphoglycolate phosphatase-like HAD superfamily hydrolase|nr:HAD hydrolase-like protein [Phycisphaerales bacterium]
MLVLFDIDGTMLSSEGVGVRSIEETCEAMFGLPVSLEGIPIGGRLDPLIWDDVCIKYGIENTDALHRDFRKRYTKVLEKNIASIEVTILPGVQNLVDMLAKMDLVTLGLVTGNYEETGLMKIKAAGFDATLFTTNAWGTDGLVRNDLPPVAIKQHDGNCAVVLLGDTVHDVASGQQAGCKVIAVCTGSQDHATLHASEPDLLLEDLSDTEEVLHWILNSHNQ